MALRSSSGANPFADRRQKFWIEYLGRFSVSVSIMTDRRRVRASPNGRPPSCRQRASGSSGARGSRSMLPSTAQLGGNSTEAALRTHRQRIKLQRTGPPRWQHPDLGLAADKL